MRVLVHDNLNSENSRREDFILDRIDRHLDPFIGRIHHITVSLSETGIHHAPMTRCHVSASLGSFGTVVATADEDNVHQAICLALRQTSRGIRRRVEKRNTRRHHVAPEMELAEVF